MTRINEDTDFFKLEDSFTQYKGIDSILIQGDRSVMRECEVSVVIPTYKRATLLKEAIDSVIRQIGAQNYCILVIDNDPTRGCDTEKLLAGYQDRKLLYFKNAENIGMFGNQNRCFELAQSKWVVLLHDDDLLLPTFLKDCLSVVQRNEKIDGLQPKRYVWKDKGEGVHVPDCFKDSGGLRRIYDISNYVSFQAGTPSGGMFKRDAVLKLGGYNLKFHPTSDFCFSVLFSQYYRLYVLNKTLSIYRILENESLKKETLERFIINDYYLKKQILKLYKVPGFAANLLLNYCGRKQVEVLNENFNLEFSLKDVRLYLPKVHRLVYYMVRLLILLYTRPVCFIRYKFLGKSERAYLC